MCNHTKYCVITLIIKVKIVEIFQNRYLKNNNVNLDRFASMLPSDTLMVFLFTVLLIFDNKRVIDVNITIIRKYTRP